eukprot:g15085.t1
MVASLSEPAGIDGGRAGAVTMSFVGNTRGKHQESSLSKSSMKRTPSASTYAYTVTPPMTLPSRGWGDRHSGSEGYGFGVRHFTSFSRHSTGDTGSATGSCSSGSSCGGRSSSSSGRSSAAVGGGGGGNGGSRSSSTSVGVGCEGRELKQFHLSDGFSSAEEETWGSEGEIEETVVAGRRRALVTLGPNKYLGANNNNNDGSGSTYAKEEGGVGYEDEESQGLLVRGGSRLAKSGAPPCAGCLVPGVGTRRKAAVGAGRAKRRASCVARARAMGTGGGGGRDSGGRGPDVSRCRGGPGGRCGGGGDGGREVDSGAGSGSGSGSGSSHKKRPLKVSRMLFIEIENKASEPPPPSRRQQTPGVRGRAASRRARGGAAVRGPDPGERRTRRLGGGADGDADDEQGDSGDEAMCGCAERCLRVMDAWYRTLTGSTARVKFSELDQGLSSSIP